MRKRRLVAAAALLVAVAPGTLVRTTIPRGDEIDLAIEAIDDGPDMVSQHGFTREGLWQLSSARLDFGGYSALLVSGNDRLLAFSDRGTSLAFGAPDGLSTVEPRFAGVSDRGPLGSMVPDIEAATRDPASGAYWIAFENTHSLIRYSRGGAFEAARLPAEWQGWYENSGAEAMARLPDGRFLVLPERDSTGFLYPADPVQEVEPLAFRFVVPEDYNPTDMTALPDGRVLVLLRKLDWAVPPFASALALADPRGLEDGGVLELRLLLDLDAILPRENYEALALTGVEEDGTMQLWLMSDDNLSALQRTLLARLGWTGDDEWRKAHEKAREG